MYNKILDDIQDNLKGNYSRVSYEIEKIKEEESKTIKSKFCKFIDFVNELSDYNFREDFETKRRILSIVESSVEYYQHHVINKVSECRNEENYAYGDIFVLQAKKSIDDIIEEISSGSVEMEEANRNINRLSNSEKEIKEDSDIKRNSTTQEIYDVLSYELFNEIKSACCRADYVKPDEEFIAEIKNYLGGKLPNQIKDAFEEKSNDIDHIKRSYIEGFIQDTRDILQKYCKEDKSQDDKNEFVNSLKDMTYSEEILKCKDKNNGEKVRENIKENEVSRLPGDVLL